MQIVIKMNSLPRAAKIVREPQLQIMVLFILSPKLKVFIVTQPRILVLALGPNGREWGRQNARAQSESSSTEVGSWGDSWGELSGRDPESGKSRTQGNQELWRPHSRTRT